MSYLPHTPHLIPQYYYLLSYHISQFEISNIVHICSYIVSLPFIDGLQVPRGLLVSKDQLKQPQHV